MTNYHDEILNFEKIAREHTEYMRNSINLIASENVTSVEVTEAVATDFAHRYAEGQAFQRFYEGCQYVDLVEDKTKKLSCKLYDCATSPICRLASLSFITEDPVNTIFKFGYKS